MENTTTEPPVKMSICLPRDVALALEQERERLATQLRTRLSFNQIAVRMLSLGIEASANAA